MMETTDPLLIRMGRVVLDLLFPPRCIGCRQGGRWLCPECLGQVGRTDGPLCAGCGRPWRGAGLCPACRAHTPVLHGVRAPFYFEGIVQKAIHELKYHGRRVLAGPLGDLLADYLERLDWPAAAIVPVPLYRQRERARGYNQSLLLARSLAARLGRPVLANSMARGRDTRPQVGLDALTRRENVAGAFGWVAPQPPPPQVLLLDDVYTTGATMAACTEALRQAGAVEVRGLALARPR